MKVSEKEEFQPIQNIVLSKRKYIKLLFDLYIHGFRYKIMQSCYQSFMSRRPNFTQLKNAFHVQSTNYYNNPAFEPDY